MDKPTNNPPGIVTGADGTRRCWWAKEPEIYQAYHDEEWGRPEVDDFRLFEKLCLEAFQSGLSWLTILRKRDNFRRAFRDFDFHKIARFGARETAKLLGDAGIVRHRGKIEATIHNARRAIDLAGESGSLAAYFWRWEPASAARPGEPGQAEPPALSPSPTAVALSKDLRRRGWKFVGPATCQSFMQAAGLVNDHLPGCPARGEVEQARRAFVRPGPAPA